jgi:hypothetical protein
VTWACPKSCSSSHLAVSWLYSIGWGTVVRTSYWLPRMVLLQNRLASMRDKSPLLTQKRNSPQSSTSFHSHV